MADTSRKVARKALGALLKAALEGTGKLAEAVYDHLPDSFGGVSPVVCVASSGTAPAGRGIGGSGVALNLFYYEIMVFTATPEGALWTDEMAQDTQDDIEAVIRGVVRNNTTNLAWSQLKFSGQGRSTQPGDRSRMLPVKVGGLSYDLESIFVEAQVYD
jgi:hypothetical protein